MKKIIDSFSDEFECFSNFYIEDVEFEGIVYPSNEHAFQAAKTLDINERKEIAKALTPGRAKRMGRKVKLRSDWENIKTDVMKELVFKKFSNKEILKAKLLDTEDAILIEGNNWGDKIWGQVNGIGENRLGKILMKVREELKK